MLLIVAVVGVMLAGCSSGGASGVVDDDPETTAALTRTAGPLELALGYDDELGSVEEQTADLIADNARMEDAVAACMKEQGFEYWPSEPVLEDFSVDDGPEPGMPEFAAQWGYGVWSFPDESYGSSGSVSGVFREAPEQTEYVEGLSDEARAEYEAALWGADGCREVAADELDGEAPVDPARAEAEEYLWGLWESSALDPVDAAWSECMRGEGYAFTRPRDARQSVMDDSDRYTVDGEPITPWEMTEKIDEEIALAQADVGCQVSTDYVRQSDRIMHELQQEYLDQHPELLGP
ncbi:hypothetical protein [Salana multivorans]